MNVNPTLSLAGIWKFNGGSTDSAFVDFYSIIHLGPTKSQGVVLGGWAIPYASLATPEQTTIAILDQNGDGTLKLDTAKYVTNPNTNGIGSVIVTDFNGDGVDDIFLASYNEDPFANEPGIVYLSNGNNGYSRLTLADATSSHSAILTAYNGIPTVVTAGYSGNDPYYQFNTQTNTFTIANWNYSAPSSLYGSSATVGDFLGNGQYELVVVDTNNTKILGPSGPPSIVLNPLSGNTFDYNAGIVLPTPYFSNNPNYPGASTHQYRVWTEDFNHDGKLDLMIAESTAMGVPRQASKIQMLQNQGNFVFADKTDALGSAYATTTNNVDYSMQMVDLDGSGIHSYLLGDSPVSANTTQSNYLLLNDGTGKFYTALHDEFVTWSANVKAFLDGNKIKYNNALSAKFIGYQVANGSIDYLADVPTGDGMSEALVNVPVQYNITTDFTQNITVSDRNNSILMRTWAGNDTFYDANANASAGHIDGGLGFNTSVYSDKAADYAITNLGGSSFEVKHTVTNLAPNVDDTLVNINRLSFTDTMVALDTGANQTAGNAYLLYQAAFNRTPDTPGLGYWIAQMDKGANVITGVAENFILSNEFKGLYGSSPTVDQFTNLLYVNVLHRSADAAGLKYWEDQFAGTGFNLLTQAQTLNNFAISNENQANAATQIAHGIHYQAYVG